MGDNYAYRVYKVELSTINHTHVVAKLLLLSYNRFLCYMWYLYSGNTWLFVHWQWNPREWSLNARQAKPGVHLVDTARVCIIVNQHTTNCSCFYHTCLFKKAKVYSFMWWNMYLFSFQSRELILQFVSSGLMRLDEKSCYCCYKVVIMVETSSCHGCTIPMSDINKAVSQWLLTFNLCVSVTWPLTCAFPIRCAHIP